jgi:thioredoxin-related protein
MFEKVLSFKSEDDKIVYHRIFYVGCQFADIAFHDDPIKGNQIVDALKEIMIKQAKVVEEIKLYQSNKTACEKELIKETERGISAIPTRELSRNIENFLTLAKGLLDIFARQFLKVMLNYDGKWNCEQIITHLRMHDGLEKSIVEHMINTLKRENEEWLKDFVDDRNLHHEKNIGLSSISIVNGQPFMKLTRRNGQEVTDILGYLRYHYNKVFSLIEYLIRMSFCALNPEWKLVYLSEWANPLDYT